MSRYTRREFLKTGLAAGTLAATGSLPLFATRQTATDWVTLGKSGVKVTRLAFGTGSFSGQVQRDLGQDGFTRLVRYAYDNGIRFFETAESYGDMRRESARKIRRAAQAREYRILRRYALALATYRDLARGHQQVAGWNSRGSVKESDSKSWRVGSRTSRLASSPRK